jgi:GT2 family glycosyltransferase
MRLDNDMLLASVDWLGKLFALWRHGHPLSSLGATPDFKNFSAHIDKMETPDGALGICTTTLPGAMMLIPKEVIDRIGMWNEEYGLFGGDDGDYGLRMNAANFVQYYFNPEGMVSHKGVGTEGKAEKAYLHGHVNREKEHHELFVHKEGGIGLFPLNYLLYHCCARTWKPIRRYCIDNIDEDHVVILRERPEFKTAMDALAKCKEIVDGALIRRHGPLDGKIIARLKRITADAGIGLE